MNRRHPTNDIRTDNAATDQANSLMTQRGAIDWSELRGECVRLGELAAAHIMGGTGHHDGRHHSAYKHRLDQNRGARAGEAWTFLEPAGDDDAGAPPLPPKPPGLVRSPPARVRLSPFAVVASPGGYVRGVPPAASLADFPVIPRGARRTIPRRPRSLIVTRWWVMPRKPV